MSLRFHPPQHAVVLPAMEFSDPHIAATLDAASPREIDAASFGVIEIDDAGSVMFYNQYEASFSGLNPEQVIGRNFFKNVAPCTNNRLFQGRFERGVQRGSIDEMFSFVFSYRMRPTLVDVRLVRGTGGRNWLLVQEKSPLAEYASKPTGEAYGAAPAVGPGVNQTESLAA